jgi:hypothetical protein
MNIFSYLTAFCLTFALSLQTPVTSPESLTDGLVAHYNFNNCRPDDLTNGGSDGEMYGQTSCHCGVEGNGLFFDGINDYMEFPGRVNQCFNTIDFTVSFYVKPGKYSVFPQSMLAKRAWCQDTVMLDLQFQSPQRKIKTDIYESPFKYFKNISPDLPDTEWIHFALVRKGTRARTYINGELRREARKCSGVDIGNEALLSFANSPCVNGGRTVRFKGGLDELRVYNRALTDEEIAEIYALHPVELAEADCVTYDGDNSGTEYLCEN